MSLAFRVNLLFLFIIGVLYTGLVTGVSQLFFTNKANGSLIYSNNKLVGSEFVGQLFISDNYFHGRPSAINYDAKLSGATNLSSVSKVVLKEFEAKKDKREAIPEMITRSASGLDPHISYDAAISQISRVMLHRKKINDKKELLDLIESNVEKRDFEIFGQKRVNVLKLNIELDKMAGD